MSLLYLPVSIGEALDKLSILHIKLNRIQDHRKKDVQIEYDAIYKSMESLVTKYSIFYKHMIFINEIIWEQMSILRDGNMDQPELCHECIQCNDVRFRLKSKINCISNSEIKEQKSYQICPIGIRILQQPLSPLFTKIILILSFLYDQVFVDSAFEMTLLKQHFQYDPTIIFKTDESLVFIEFTEENYLDHLTHPLFEKWMKRF